MIPYKEVGGGVAFGVRIAPRASSSKIVGEHNGALKIRVAAPPVEGAANRELIRFLAKYFQVPQNAVEIVSGATSKTKVVRIKHVSAFILDRLRAVE